MRKPSARHHTAQPPLTVALSIDATAAASPAWDAVWRELLLPPRAGADTACAPKLAPRHEHMEPLILRLAADPAAATDEGSATEGGDRP